MTQIALRPAIGWARFFLHVWTERGVLRSMVGRGRHNKTGYADIRITHDLDLLLLFWRRRRRSFAVLLALGFPGSPGGTWDWHAGRDPSGVRVPVATALLCVRQSASAASPSLPVRTLAITGRTSTVMHDTAARLASAAAGQFALGAHRHTGWVVRRSRPAARVRRCSAWRSALPRGWRPGRQPGT